MLNFKACTLIAVVALAACSEKEKFALEGPSLPATPEIASQIDRCISGVTSCAGDFFRVSGNSRPYLFSPVANKTNEYNQFVSVGDLRSMKEAGRLGLIIEHISLTDPAYPHVAAEYYGRASSSPQSASASP